MSTREHAGRALVDARSQGGRCELCGRLGTNVHHRMRQGRPWNGANLLRVCGSGNASGCHGWIETHPLHAVALGLIVHRQFDPVGWPVFCRPVLFHLGWWFAENDGTWIPTEVHQTPAMNAAIDELGDFLDAMRDAE